MLLGSGGFAGPLSGTLRLYVDGTLGNDAAAGTSWAAAWKTMARLEIGIAEILFVQPTALTLIAYVRGAFAAENLHLLVLLQGTSAFFLIHALADHTLNQTGTVAAVTATAEKHGLPYLTLAGGIVLTAADIGRTLKLTNGTHTGTTTIIDVDATNNYAWCSKDGFPAWVINGIVATIHTPSMTGLANLTLSGTAADRNHWPTQFLLGLAFDHSMFRSGSWVSSFRATNATSAVHVRQAELARMMNTEIGVAASLAVLEEAGFMFGASGFVDLGLDLPTGFVELVQGSAWISGYVGGQSTISNAGMLQINCARVGGAMAVGGTLAVTKIISHGQIWGSRGAGLYASLVTHKRLPAAGISDGLWKFRACHVLLLQNCDGENTGTGSNLLGVLVSYGASGWFGADVLCNGKHGKIVVETDGGMAFGSDLVIGASEGSGPDILVKTGGRLAFNGNVTKSAVNSETAIQTGVDGQITAATKRFTAATAVFTAAHVGRSVKIANTINPGNVGVHEITAFVDANNVTLNNMAAPVNEGPGLTWGLVGTPRPIFEVARGGRISQADGKTFTVRIPEVEPAPGSGVQEWSRYGYGLANQGFAHIHEGGEAVLGTLALSGVGAAGAGGIAAKIKNASKLLHKGGAVILGTAPLDLGGNAGAIAWPATPSSDAASAAPQQCIVIPDVP